MPINLHAGPYALKSRRFNYLIARHIVTADSDLGQRFCHLHYVESELNRNKSLSELQMDLIPKAQETFRPFGKTLIYMILRVENIYTISMPDPYIPNNIRYYTTNGTPPPHPQDEILQKACRDMILAHETDGRREYLAMPLIRNLVTVQGEERQVVGMMLFSNEISSKPFTKDDIEIAREFSEVISDAITDLVRRLSAS